MQSQMIQTCVAWKLCRIGRQLGDLGWGHLPLYHSASEKSQDAKKKKPVGYKWWTPYNTINHVNKTFMTYIMKVCWKRDVVFDQPIKWTSVKPLQAPRLLWTGQGLGKDPRSLESRPRPPRGLVNKNNIPMQKCLKKVETILRISKNI